MNVLKATKLYVLKWLTQSVLCYMAFFSIRKRERDHVGRTCSVKTARSVVTVSPGSAEREGEEMWKGAGGRVLLTACWQQGVWLTAVPLCLKGLEA